MDLKNPDVCQSLPEEDELRRANRRSQAIWAAVPIAGATMILLGGGIIGIAIGGAVGYGASLALAANFPARQLFPWLKN